MVGSWVRDKIMTIYDFPMNEYGKDEDGHNQDIDITLESVGATKVEDIVKADDFALMVKKQ